MGLLALGVGKGDEVVVPAFTFVATPNVVEYTGAKPVFTDIDLDTFNIDVSDAASRMGDRTRVIIPVHLFGMCADMRAVSRLAAEYGVGILEDAACALGSTYRGQYAGVMGDAGCFSFHPRKSLTTGEGGLLVTNDARVFEQVHSLRDFGFETTNLERHKADAASMPDVRMLGYNYRMTDIQAAIGIEQYKKFAYTVSERQKRARVYDTELAGLPWLKLPGIAHKCNHTYQSYVTLVWDAEVKRPTEGQIDRFENLRNRIVAQLTEQGIFTRQGTQAVHALEYYRTKYGINGMDYPMAWVAARLSITLPLYPQMTDDEQEYVITALRSIKL